MTVAADIFPDGCGWLVEVPSGHPEPDFPEDLYQVVECGAPVEIVEHTLGDRTLEGWRCSNGHEHVPIEIAWAPYGPAWEADQEADEEERRRG